MTEGCSTIAFLNVYINVYIMRRVENGKTHKIQGKMNKKAYKYLL